MDNQYTPKKYLEVEKKPPKNDIFAVMKYLEDLDEKGFRIVTKPTFIEKWALPCFYIFIFIFCLVLFSEIGTLKRQIKNTDATLNAFIEMVVNRGSR